MATVRPFKALRYRDASEQVVAPPYDVIGPERRQQLMQSSAHNIVWLTLPEGDGDKYETAAQTLARWIGEGALREDDRPGFYRYVQTFRHPLTGQEVSRTGLIVTLKTEPYEKGVVLPHEQTFPGVKEDRFRLLQATRTHLESIFGLYESNSALQEALGRASFRLVAQLEHPDLPEGYSQRLEVADEPSDTEAISRAFEPLRIWIADGHHRYETALRYGMESGDENSPTRFLPILLVSMEDPGLVILPTHRALTSDPAPDWQSAIGERFDARAVSLSSLLNEMERAADAANPGIGFVNREQAWLITPRQGLDMRSILGEGVSDALANLDVNVLHQALMPAMGFGDAAPEFTHDPRQALDGVERGAYCSAFLLNPPSLAAMSEIANRGEKMPKKSTYFYPKALSGLVMWRIPGGN